MLRSFLKLTFRHISKQWNYSIINIGGFAIGIACSFVIVLYAFQELSYEKKFDNHQRTFRIATHFMTMGDFASAPLELARTLSNDYPWVEEVATAKVMGELPLILDERESSGIGLEVTDNFFSLFNYPVVSGNSQQPLANLSSVVITRELAFKLFGSESPLGKTIEIGKNKEEYTVSAVVDISEIKSHVNVDFWTASEKKPLDLEESNWLSASSMVYIMTNGNVTKSDIQDAADQLIEKNVYPRMGSNVTFDEWIARDDAFRFIVQPIDDIYLKGVLSFDISAGGNETAVYVLLVIAILILVIASVNFVNLTTAKAEKRAKEIGIRKVIGGVRTSLITQFMMESIFISLMAVVLALGIAEIILMLFEQVTGLILFNSVFENVYNIFLALGIGLLVGILSGFYPAIYLSSFNPIESIKKGTHSSRSNAFFRNSLVVFQFTLSLALITSTLIIFGQLKFMKEKDLGFNRHDVLVLDNAYVLGNSFNDLKFKLENYDGVVSVSQVNMLPGSDNSFSLTNLRLEGNEDQVKANFFRADDETLNTLQLELLQGRNFDPNRASDSMAIILNEEAIESLGLDEPINVELENGRVIIGVVRDFNFESLRADIGPAALSYEPGYGQKMAVRIEEGKYQGVIDFINSEWNNNLQNDPLTYFFLDDNFQKLMKKDEEMGKVVSMFTILAILISCLGLFGLSSYTIALKRKEIGIRKIMGATTNSILILLNWKFSRLVLLAMAIATPLAALGMERWLSDFAYRIDVNYFYFLLSFIITILISWVTVSYQSTKAALSNPVNSLREE